MREKDFQRLFSAYIAANKPKATTVWELKMAKGPSIRWDVVASHQIHGLLDAEEDGLYHKISDSPIFPGMKTRFTKPKPFDCFAIVKAKAYIVIWFYKPRAKKVMLWISVRDWLAESSKSKRKSLTEQRAREISKAIINF